MEADILGNMRKQANTIDNGIKQLEKRWESPYNILCHRGENDAEAKKVINDFIQPIKEIRKELTEDMGPRADYMKDMDRFLEECNTACNELKQGVDDIEALFSEYGYVKPDNGECKYNLDDGVDGIKLESDLNNSILNIEEMNNLTLDSSSVDQLHNISPVPVPSNFNSNTPKYIATPVIKSVASAMAAESLKKK